jgi:hypothetical protein
VLLSSSPVPALRHLIRYYYQVETHLVGRTVLQPVPARSPQAIEFTFGTPYEVYRLDRGGVEKANPIALIGAQTFRRVDLIMHGRVDAFTIVFQPGGMFAFFSVPAEKLTNGPMTTSTGRQRSAGGSANLSAGWVMPSRLPTAFVLRTNTYARSVPRSIPSAPLRTPQRKYF